MSKISVKSLGQGTRQGWLTKQGGSIKTWKKRWFILKGDTLFYFKTQKAQDVTGSITLEPTSTCQAVPAKSNAKKHFFSVATTRRTFLMWASDEKTAQDWVKVINEKIAEKNNKGGSGGSGSTGDSGSPTPSAPSDTGGDAEKSAAADTDKAVTPDVKEQEVEKPKEDTDPEPSASDASSPDTTAPTEKKSDDSASPRKKIAVAKNSVPFLQDEESKVLEFWQIWSESIPGNEELQPGAGIEFHVSTSAKMDKLTWRTAGPQNIFIQKMVDFFWNVGAPESEIDRLNDVGALINPIRIGSWIDMSSKGGMDGGWYFPVEIPLKMAIEAADPGGPSKMVAEWAEKYSVEKCFSVGRDMGAAPPRQTEIRVRLPGTTFEAQLNVAQEAFTMFSFPAIPDDAMNALKAEAKLGLCLSIITSSEGFVRLGLMSPDPSTDTVLKLCECVGANSNATLAAFEGAMGSKGPQYVECQFLKEGFGYGVYHEGFGILYHYNVGTETESS
mmetsp:Transcript_3897/g.5841  ORF Transcript_3897/g.5841 Transcript_3897/m.5841 type:complete len:500 (-) Transcript_3897:103-1602(-)